MTTRLKLRPAAIQRATYQFWHAYVPPGYTVADLLVPTVWALQADRLRQHDLVRASAANGSFDVMLTVQNKWLAAWLADPHGVPRPWRSSRLAPLLPSVAGPRGVPYLALGDGRRALDDALHALR
jgi:hypothetical protein